jgi:hypothetical protein
MTSEVRAWPNDRAGSRAEAPGVNYRLPVSAP